MSINKEDFRSFIKDILFENHLKEMFMPDNYTSSRDIPNIKKSNSDGGGVEHEKDFILPITGDNFVDKNLNKRNINARDKQYIPKSVELQSALYSIIDDCDNENLTDEVAKTIWASVTKILNKNQD